MKHLKFYHFLKAFVSALLCLVSSVSIAQTAAKTTKAVAAAKTTAAAISTDALGAKALLEDLMVRRITQEISTRLNKDSYSVSAQLEISLLDFEDVKAQEPVSDLMLGFLDPEDLLKNVAGKGGAADTLGTFLSQYGIKSVVVSVGLKQDVSEAKKQEVKTWLETRMKEEFGTNGKGLVNYIELPTITTEKPQTPLQQIKDLQGLLGQIALAIALFLGALVWGMMAKPRENSSVKEAAANAAAQAASQQEAANSNMVIERRAKENEIVKKEIDELTVRLIELSAKAKDSFEMVVRNWCNGGEAGRFRLVCFAEAVQKDLGRLPIPVDAIEDVKKIFSQMPAVQLAEKKTALEKVYWDLLQVVNLGSESLVTPFSYLSNAKMESVQTVLIEKNAKMRALVTLYMPEELRFEYLRSLDSEKKKEILSSAAQLDAISLAEFKTLDQQIEGQLQQLSTGGEESIRLESPLAKVIAGFTLLEQMQYLREVPSEMIKNYKKSVPCLAFLDEWPDNGLSRLVNKMTVDEIVNLIGCLPVVEQRILSLAPPMSAEMAKDELKRTSTLSDTDRNRLLENLLEKVELLHNNKEIQLSSYFDGKSSDSLRLVS